MIGPDSAGDLSPRRGVISILGVPVQAISVGELHARIDRCIESGKRELILNVNAHAMNIAYRDERLKRLFCRADLVFADGSGVVLAARLLGARFPGRITYADWIWQLAAFAEERGYSLYFLGARKGVADRAADHLQNRHPGLRIVGIRDGYFERSPSSAENRRVVAAINRANPDILIIGLGMPLQEFWLEENWHSLNARIGLTGGAVFDYTSGQLMRGPAVLVNHGFESVARLIVEPRRLFRRYIVGNPLFLWRVSVEAGRFRAARVRPRLGDLVGRRYR